MINALRAELLKLRRPGMLWGVFGIVVGMALLVCALILATAKTQAEIVADATAAAQSGQIGRSPSVAFETLEKPGGYAYAFQLAAQVIGVVSLVAFAQNVGSEYGQGTLKVLFTREPRRLRVLAGKMVVLSILVVLAILAAFVLQTGLAAAIAAGRGISMAQWWTAASLLDGLLLVLRVAGAAIVWGAMGTMLAVLLRAAPAAIGIGIGYTLLVEGLLTFALKGQTKWLPGQALQSFVGWGQTPNAQVELLPPVVATAVVAIDLLVFTIVASSALLRRDVT